MKIKSTYLIRMFLLIFLFGEISIRLNAQQLSEKAEISILTIGPGKKDLYSCFGHSAIRVNDPAMRYDAAYNYGTFDFDQPNFYLNFAKGYLIYKLAVQDYQRLKEHYIYNDRSITEQVLNLSLEQKQKVFDYLQNNAKTENANYYYDYFYDNCATKIGDVFVESLGSEFRFDENFVNEPGLTIRTLTDHYSAEGFPWGKLGIDLCLGIPMDKQLNNMEYTFLPDYVLGAFSMAKIEIRDVWKPAVKSTSNIYWAKSDKVEAIFFTPMRAFWIFFGVVALLTVIFIKKNKKLKVFDFVLFLTVGLLGLFFLLLWLATDHAAAAWNLNILWAWPIHLVVAFWFIKRSRPRWLNWYFLVTALFGVLLVILWVFLPQALNYALIPIALTIALRSFAFVIQSE
ncbi:MAG: DUF4105 domain-containing protein [Bacteroidota bacterium]